MCCVCSSGLRNAYMSFILLPSHAPPILHDCFPFRLKTSFFYFILKRAVLSELCLTIVVPFSLAQDHLTSSSAYSKDDLNPPLSTSPITHDIFTLFCLFDIAQHLALTKSFFARSCQDTNPPLVQSPSTLHRPNRPRLRRSHSELNPHSNHHTRPPPTFHASSP